MNKYMAKIIKKIICFVLSFFFIAAHVSVYAHPGRTDSNGGHYDRSTGEYHYHHGYPAHAHYDMDGDGTIDCPFDFDDKTNHSFSSTSQSSSSSSSSSRSAQSSSNNYVAAAVATEKENNEALIMIIMLAVLFGPSLLLCLYSLISDHFNGDLKKRQKWDAEHPDLVRLKCAECKFCKKKTMWAGRYPNGYPQRVPTYCGYLKSEIGPDYSCRIAEPPENLCKHKDAVSPFPSSDTVTYFSVYGDYYHSSGSCPHLKGAKRLYHRIGAPSDRRPCPNCWTEINGVLYPKK